MCSPTPAGTPTAGKAGARPGTPGTLGPARATSSPSGRRSLPRGPGSLRWSPTTVRCRGGVVAASCPCGRGSVWCAAGEQGEQVQRLAHGVAVRSCDVVRWHRASRVHGDTSPSRGWVAAGDGMPIGRSRCLASPNRRRGRRAPARRCDRWWGGPRRRRQEQADDEHDQGARLDPTVAMPPPRAASPYPSVVRGGGDGGSSLRQHLRHEPCGSW